MPSLPIWSLPAYELALMTATRARARGHDVEVLLITPEDAPLAALGTGREHRGRADTRAGGCPRTTTSASAQIREPGKISLYPMRRSLTVDEVIALPELYAPAVPGRADERRARLLHDRPVRGRSRTGSGIRGWGHHRHAGQERRSGG